MSGQGMISGLIVFGVVIAVLSHFNNEKGVALSTSTASEAAQISKLLEIISAGTADINFILAAAPLVIIEHEKVVAVLPKTALLEPKTVRVRQGNRHGSSMRMGFGYSTGSGGYTSITETREQLKTVDEGTLVVTDQRVAFLGALKTIAIDVDKIIGVDESRDGIALHCEGKEKVESFKISEELMLTYREDQKEVSVPFAGQILERIISQTMATLGHHNQTFVTGS
jgi:hypothetical protein